MVISHPSAGYRFLAGIAPYSCGVAALPGYEIVRAALRNALPWRDGFAAIDRFLAERKLPRSALCGIELRCPAPYSMGNFVAFNRQYARVLEEWNLLVDGVNPLARTNVAPCLDPPTEPQLHGFSAALPAANAPPTFVIAGAGELRDGRLAEEGIVRRGEISAPALAEKARYVMDVMTERLQALGGDWSLVNQIQVYTRHPADDLLRREIEPRIGPAARHGVRWVHARPPVEEIEFEMDLRGTCSELAV